MYIIMCASIFEVYLSLLRRIVDQRPSKVISIQNWSSVVQNPLQTLNLQSPITFTMYI